MSLKVSHDFRYRAGRADCFSSAESNWVFIESTDLAKSGETAPPLRISDHVEMVQNILHCQVCECLWMVESASEQALELLRRRFPEFHQSGCSIGGYFSPDAQHIEAFWDIFRRLDNTEPWNQEQPWVLAGVPQRLPVHQPMPSRAEDLFRNHRAMRSVFVQEGWFAYFGAERSPEAVCIIQKEFPALFEAQT